MARGRTQTLLALTSVLITVMLCIFFFFVTKSVKMETFGLTVNSGLKATATTYRWYCPNRLSEAVTERAFPRIEESLAAGEVGFSVVIPISQTQTLKFGRNNRGSGSSSRD